MPVSPEQFFRLVEASTFRVRDEPEHTARRNRAAAVLAYCSGLLFPEVTALRMGEWCPSGEDCLVVSGERADAVEAALATRPRRIPVSPAARWAVGSYLAALGKKPDAQTCFFVLPDDGPDPARALKNAVQNIIRRMAPEDRAIIRTGDLRATFEIFIRRFDDRDGLADYLIGSVTRGDGIDRFAEVPPSLDRLHQLLRRAHPVYSDDRIWRPVRHPMPV